MLSSEDMDERSGSPAAVVAAVTPAAADTVVVRSSPGGTRILGRNVNGTGEFLLYIYIVPLLL